MAKVYNLHELLEVLLSSSSYEKLILHCCGLDQVYPFLFILILWASLNLKNVNHKKEGREEKKDRKKNDNLISIESLFRALKPVSMHPSHG